MNNPYDRQVAGSHYKHFEIEPAYFINTVGLPFTLGNAVKYLLRDKGSRKEDLNKAIHYLEMEIYHRGSFLFGFKAFVSSSYRWLVHYRLMTAFIEQFNDAALELILAEILLNEDLNEAIRLIKREI